MTRTALAALGVLLLLPFGAAAGPSLRAVLPSENPPSGWVESSALGANLLEELRALQPGELAAILVVRVESEEELPAMLGKVELTADAIRFWPRFPWRPGLQYRATLSLPHQAPTQLKFSIPEAETRAQTRVEAVLPASQSVPANLLRFYVEFSAPMGSGAVLPYIELLDENGVAIQEAFVETVPLWDASRRRLTLICHPGRIKRGLALHDRLGAPLSGSASVRLRVHQEFPDAAGQPLIAAYERSYTVGTEDRSSPDPLQWRCSTPRTGSQAALRIDFDDALDVTLLERMLAVEGPGGRVVRGVDSPLPDGRGWEFEPAEPWRGGRYEIVIAAALEDLAGNRIDAPFESAPGHDSLSEPRRLTFELPPIAP